MLQPRMSYVLRYQEAVMEHGEKSPEAWLAGCELLADAVTDPRRTAEQWDRNPKDALEMIEKVVLKATEGMVPPEEIEKLKEQAKQGNSLSSAPST